MPDTDDIHKSDDGDPNKDGLLTEDTTSDDEGDEQLNLRMFGIHQALPVPQGEPDWDAGPPDSAEEYLRRVRAEAAACPRVVRVEFDAATHAAKRRARDAAAAVAAANTTATQQHVHHQADDGGGDGQQDSHASRHHVDHRAGDQHPRRAPRGSSTMPAYVTRLLAAAQQLREGPAWSQPTAEWVRELVADFRRLRQWLGRAMEEQAPALRLQSRLPPVSDVRSWDRIWSSADGCLGPPAPATAASALLTPLTSSSDNTPQPLVAPTPVADSSTTQVASSRLAGGLAGLPSDTAPPPPPHSAHLAAADSIATPIIAPAMDRVSQPVLSAVLCIDQVGVAALLQRLIAQVDGAPGLSHGVCQWLFALVAVLEKPAHSDVVAALRSLARRMAQLRCGLADMSDPQLPRVNTLAVLAGAYFGQDEKLVAWVSDMELP